MKITQAARETVLNSRRKASRIVDRYRDLACQVVFGESFDETTNRLRQTVDGKPLAADSSNAPWEMHLGVSPACPLGQWWPVLPEVETAKAIKVDTRMDASCEDGCVYDEFAPGSQGRLDAMRAAVESNGEAILFVWTDAEIADIFARKASGIQVKVDGKNRNKIQDQMEG